MLSVALTTGVLLRAGRAAPLTSATSRAERSARSRMALQPRSNLGSASAAQAAYTLGGGYSLTPGKDGTGGWLAHRSDLDLPGSGPGDDWVHEAFNNPDGGLAALASPLPGAKLTHPLRVLIMYGSLRETSFSRRLAHECARLLELMGADG